MDKNKCPKNDCQKRLTDKKIYYDILFLSSQIKPFILFLIMIFFYILFKKGFRHFFYFHIIKEWK
jgi:hypothetical protein